MEKRAQRHQHQCEGCVFFFNVMDVEHQASLLLEQSDGEDELALVRLTRCYNFAVRECTAGHRIGVQ